jgi:hypothetical protein
VRHNGFLVKDIQYLDDLVSEEKRTAERQTYLIRQADGLHTRSKKKPDKPASVTNSTAGGSLRARWRASTVENVFHENEDISKKAEDEALRGGELFQIQEKLVEDKDKIAVEVKAVFKEIKKACDHEFAVDAQGVTSRPTNVMANGYHNVWTDHHEKFYLMFKKRRPTDTLYLQKRPEAVMTSFLLTYEFKQLESQMLRIMSASNTRPSTPRRKKSDVNEDRLRKKKGNAATVVQKYVRAWAARRATKPKLSKVRQARTEAQMRAKAGVLGSIPTSEFGSEGVSTSGSDTAQVETISEFPNDGKGVSMDIQQLPHSKYKKRSTFRSPNTMKGRPLGGPDNSGMGLLSDIGFSRVVSRGKVQTAKSGFERLEQFQRAHQLWSSVRTRFIQPENEVDEGDPRTSPQGESPLAEEGHHDSHHQTRSERRMTAAVSLTNKFMQEDTYKDALSAAGDILKYWPSKHLTMNENNVEYVECVIEVQRCVRGFLERKRAEKAVAAAAASDSSTDSDDSSDDGENAPLQGAEEPTLGQNLALGLKDLFLWEDAGAARPMQHLEKDEMDKVRQFAHAVVDTTVTRVTGRLFGFVGGKVLLMMNAPASAKKQIMRSPQHKSDAQKSSNAALQKKMLGCLMMNLLDDSDIPNHVHKPMSYLERLNIKSERLHRGASSGDLTIPRAAIERAARKRPRSSKNVRSLASPVRVMSKTAPIAPSNFGRSHSQKEFWPVSNLEDAAIAGAIVTQPASASAHILKPAKSSPHSSQKGSVSRGIASANIPLQKKPREMPMFTSPKLKKLSPQELETAEMVVADYTLEEAKRIALVLVKNRQKYLTKRTNLQRKWSEAWNNQVKGRKDLANRQEDFRAQLKRTERRLRRAHLLKSPHSRDHAKDAAGPPENRPENAFGVKITFGVTKEPEPDNADSVPQKAQPDIAPVRKSRSNPKRNGDGKSRTPLPDAKKGGSRSGRTKDKLATQERLEKLNPKRTFELGKHYNTITRQFGGGKLTNWQKQRVHSYDNDAARVLQRLFRGFVGRAFLWSLKMHTYYWWKFFHQNDGSLYCFDGSVEGEANMSGFDRRMNDYNQFMDEDALYAFRVGHHDETLPFKDFILWWQMNLPEIEDINTTLLFVQLARRYRSAHLQTQYLKGMDVIAAQRKEAMKAHRTMMEKKGISAFVSEKVEEAAKGVEKQVKDSSKQMKDWLQDNLLGMNQLRKGRNVDACWSKVIAHVHVARLELRKSGRKTEGGTCKVGSPSPATGTAAKTSGNYVLQ